MRSQMDIKLEDVAPRKARGSEHPAAKLNEREVVHIRKLHSEGASIMGLARVFEVTPPTIRSLLKRKTWAHV